MTPEEPNEADANTIAAIKDFFMSFLAKKSAASCSLGFEIGNFMLANAQAYESGRGLDVQKRQRVMADNDGAGRSNRYRLLHRETRADQV
jgi:hypothetical protein